MTEIADRQQSKLHSTAETSRPTGLNQQMESRHNLDNARQQALLREVTTTLLITIVLFLGLRYSGPGSSARWPQHAARPTREVSACWSGLARLLIFRQPQRGDVIVFHPPDALTQRYIKRVIRFARMMTVRLTLPQMSTSMASSLNESYIAPAPYGYPENLRARDCSSSGTRPILRDGG